ncbi:MAG: hypothetical protein COW18_06220 [Zetaproteobacteria bacterium CG12_big_fil_rev_8_21_14_0_65_54_13]|nr:MAG: hypothetical protein COX55_07275 [Zetaproteobacteria bacterium CG23_combo_of_CG06-09_8_20_14_all_54_7]PIW49141.1 MAG: hypothetical protein COW18_06220 [Zetaproteobacteria bacterium CG12_big_fil_rev_8_21_14_0_65_54_13]PIX55789.1 MAG: hypothetical protein COZ50_00915 [Zetaproteobacteria bacterium CG_4_10_14_3_um_filter_54_28]PJA27604.1 MAG: hypothetical protein CO188_12085 [Zetaproteobacteria bacterium CG_4_9_14_3_um_filter_54_145]
MTDSVPQMMIDKPESLISLIGRRVRYLNEEYEVTDLLVEEGLMILSSADSEQVQDDSYGRPSRLVPKREQLRFRDAHGQSTSIWEELAFLDGPLPG